MEMDNNAIPQRRSAPAPSPSEAHQTERLGLWIGLGAAAAVTVGVLALALYTDYQDNKTSAQPVAETVIIQENISIVPLSQAEAERLALEQSESQSQGMTAPSEINPDTVPDTAIASHPAQAVLAPNSMVTDEAQIIVENGIVKFYFATGKAELADNVTVSLTDIVAGVREGKTAVVSGYTDSTGDDALNEQLAKERALKVHAALMAVGIPERNIEMQKPQNITGSGNKEEARRVEVILK